MVPVNLGVGVVSTWVSDRVMVVGSLAACIAGLGVLTLGPGSAAAFFGGGVVLFTASVVLEGTATRCAWLDVRIVPPPGLYAAQTQPVSFLSRVQPHVQGDLAGLCHRRAQRW